MYSDTANTEEKGKRNSNHDCSLILTASKHLEVTFWLFFLLPTDFIITSSLISLALVSSNIKKTF